VEYSSLAGKLSVFVLTDAAYRGLDLCSVHARVDGRLRRSDSRGTRIPRGRGTRHPAYSFLMAISATFFTEDERAIRERIEVCQVSLKGAGDGEGDGLGGYEVEETARRIRELDFYRVSAVCLSRGHLNGVVII
jgi:hypothetical protein